MRMTLEIRLDRKLANKARIIVLARDPMNELRLHFTDI